MADFRRGPSVCDVQFLLKSPQVPRQIPTPPLDNGAGTIHMPKPMYSGMLVNQPSIPLPVITPSNTPFSPSRTRVNQMVRPVMASSGTSKDLAFISHSPSTFPLQDPAIDNAQLARRKRRRTSPMELTILESEFKQCYKPNKMAREEIAQKVCMTEKAVQIWFQNRRQSQRKQQQVVKLDTFDLDVNSSGSEGKTNGPPVRPRPGLVRTHSHISDYHQDYSDMTNNNNNTPFTIYNDPEVQVASRQPEPAQTQPSTTNPPRKRTSTPSLKLSMSDDGKAQVVISTSPLKPISGNRQPQHQLPGKPSLKLHRSFSGNNRPKSASAGRSSMSFTNGADPKIKDKEAECITNLLSLRSGVWN